MERCRIKEERKLSSSKFLDETEYLLSSVKNKKILMKGIEQLEKDEKGRTIKNSELWK